MGDHMLVQISTFFKIKNYDTNIVYIIYIVYLYGKKKTINFSTCTAVSIGLSYIQFLVAGSRMLKSRCLLGV